MIFDVYVRTNLSLIDSQIRALFPKDDIRLSQANGSVVLSGTVHDPKVAQQADAVIQAAGFKTVNMLESPVQNSVQVQLQVRVAEVNRNRMRDLGAGYAYQSQPGAGGFIGSGGSPYTVGAVDQGKILGSVAGSALNLFVMGGNAFTFIRALQEQGALRALAEPNLIAMNGQEASFLAVANFQCRSFRAMVAGITPPYDCIQRVRRAADFKPTILDEESHSSRIGTRSFDARFCQRCEAQWFHHSSPPHAAREDGNRIARRSELCARGIVGQQRITNTLESPRSG
jgi:pilus assembly protein CpaC